MATDYSKQTVVQLKKLASERSITAALKSGLRKADIIEKIQEFDAHEAAKAGTESAAEQVVEVPGVEEEQEEEVVEAPAIAVPDATVDDVSAVEGDRSQEPVAPPHHDPIRPVEETSLLEPSSVTETTDAEISVASIAPDELPTTEERTASSSAEADAPAAVEEFSGAQPQTTLPSSDLTTPVPVEEILEDNRKRKRRSASPSVKAEEVAAKRQRQQEESGADVAFTDAPPQESAEIEEATQPEPEKEEKEVAEKEHVEGMPAKEVPVAGPKIPTGPRTLSKDVRSLFGTKQTSKSANIVNDDDDDDDKATEPAIHHATAALYIRNFQRPLQHAQLENHLLSLASPQGAGNDADLIKTLHLDQVKTHALVLFASTTAASRVRSSLHGRVWPQERGRKELWVDFIPEEKVLEWIDKEKRADNSGRTGGRRWEVVYPSDESGDIAAIHQEEGSNPSLAPRGPTAGQGLSIKGSAGPPPNAPLGPRGSIARHVQQQPPSAPKAAPGTPPTQTQTFKTLDQLFHSTTSKPKIYWQPVSAELVQRRRDELKAETARGWTPAKWKDNDELFRYTFEGVKIVHSGPHNTSVRVRRREEEIVRGGGGGGGGRAGGGGRSGGGDRGYGRRR